MSELVGTPEDRFSRDTVQYTRYILVQTPKFVSGHSLVLCSVCASFCTKDKEPFQSSKLFKLVGKAASAVKNLG